MILKKIGSWIIFKIINFFDLELASGYNEHWSTQYHEIYRVLTDDDYNGIKIIVKEDVDTIDGSIYHENIYNRIYDRIPKNRYKITARGYFTNDVKTGNWIYYLDNDSIEKIIEYPQENQLK